MKRLNDVKGKKQEKQQCFLDSQSVMTDGSLDTELFMKKILNFPIPGGAVIFLHSGILPTTEENIVDGGDGSNYSEKSTELQAFDKNSCCDQRQVSTILKINSISSLSRTKHNQTKFQIAFYFPLASYASNILCQLLTQFANTSDKYFSIIGNFITPNEKNSFQSAVNYFLSNDISENIFGRRKLLVCRSLLKNTVESRPKILQVFLASTTKNCVEISFIYNKCNVYLIRTKICTGSLYLENNSEQKQYLCIKENSYLLKHKYLKINFGILGHKKLIFNNTIKKRAIDSVKKYNISKGNTEVLFALLKYNYIKISLAMSYQNYVCGKSEVTDCQAESVKHPNNCITEEKEIMNFESTEHLNPLKENKEEAVSPLLAFEQSNRVETPSQNTANILDTEIVYREMLDHSFFPEAHCSHENDQNWLLLDSRGHIQEISSNEVCALMKNFQEKCSAEQNNACNSSIKLFSAERSLQHERGEIVKFPKNEALLFLSQEDSQGKEIQKKPENTMDTDFLSSETCSNPCMDDIKGEEIQLSHNNDYSDNGRCFNKTSLNDLHEEEKFKGTLNKNDQETSSEFLTLMEKTFPYNSIQYAMLALKEINSNVLNIKRAMIKNYANLREHIIHHLGNKVQGDVLINVLENYTKDQVKGEQRLHSIAHHLIEEQGQIIKSYKESTQAHIAMLNNQKIILEQENTLLLKNLEETNMKNKRCSSLSTNSKDCSSILLENNKMLRNELTELKQKNNELRVLHQQMLERLEQCVSEVQKQTQEIESQKLSLNGNQNYFNIEKAYLNRKIKNYNTYLQEASGIAEVVMEDIKNLKSSLEEAGKKVSMNLDRPKGDSPIVSNVLNVCRSCIYELGLELLNTYQELTSKEKEILSLQENNAQMKNVMKEIETEYNTLRQQSEQVINEKINIEKMFIQQTQENNNLKKQLSESLKAKKDLEIELDELQEYKAASKEQEIVRTQLEKNIQELKADKENMEQKLILDEQSGRTMEVDLMKMTALLDMYENKNKELTITNHNLEEELEKSKGSLLELENLSQRYENLEKDYYKQIADKDYMNQQLTNLKNELSERFESSILNQKQIENLEVEVKKLSKENLETKWNLKNLKNVNECLEQDNCNMLNRLEEDTTKYKCQINELTLRTKDMESKNCDLEKRLDEMKNMLVIQTETIYSLQNECDEKKNEINKLEEKCHNLTILQQKDTNQILLLNSKAQELENKITTINNSNTITMNSIRYEFEEMETSLKITQEELNNTVAKLQEKEENFTSLQENMEMVEQRLLEKEHQIAENVRTIEILQNNLQDANEMKQKFVEMQELLKDYENTIHEKEKLEEDIAILQSDIETKQKDIKEQQNKNETLIKYCSLQKEHIKGMKSQINKLQEYISKLKITNKTCFEMDLHQVSSDSDVSNNKIDDLEFETEEYKFILDEKHNGNEEKCRLQSQVMLLHELHKRNSNDLKHARKSIKTLEDRIFELMTQNDEEVKKRETAERELETMKEQHIIFLKEMKSLQERVQKENENCLSLTEEYYSHQRETAEKESSLTNKIQELKSQIEVLKEQLANTNKENEGLAKTVEDMKKEETYLKAQNLELDSRLSDYGRTLSLLAQEKRKNEQLENQLQAVAAEGDNLIRLQQLLQKQHTTTTRALEDSKHELKQTREALRALEVLEQQHAKELRDTKEKYTQDNSERLEEIKLLKMKLSESERINKEQTNNEKCLVSIKKELSLKLLRSLKVIHQTKLKCMVAYEKVCELSTQVNVLREQKSLKEAEVDSLHSEIKTLNEQIKQRNYEREILISQNKKQEQIVALEQQLYGVQSQLLRAKQKLRNEIYKAESVLLIKDDLIMQSKEQIKMLQEKTSRLSAQLIETQGKVLQQNENQSKLKRDLIALQAEKREATLQLRILEGYFNEEKQRRLHLEDMYHKLLEQFSKEIKTV